MDLQMPGVDGVAATRAIVGEDARPTSLVLTSYSDSERIVAALDAGAVGYLLKDAEPEEVLAGIRAVGPRRVAAATRGPPASCSAPGVRRRPAGRRADAARDARCWRWCGRGWPTSRSPGGSASPSAPSRRT